MTLSSALSSACLFACVGVCFSLDCLGTFDHLEFWVQPSNVAEGVQLDLGRGPANKHRYLLDDPYIKIIKCADPLNTLQLDTAEFPYYARCPTDRVCTTNSLLPTGPTVGNTVGDMIIQTSDSDASKDFTCIRASHDHNLVNGDLVTFSNLPAQFTGYAGVAYCVDVHDPNDFYLKVADCSGPRVDLIGDPASTGTYTTVGASTGTWSKTTGPGMVTVTKSSGDCVLGPTSVSSSFNIDGVATEFNFRFTTPGSCVLSATVLDTAGAAIATTSSLAFVVLARSRTCFTKDGVLKHTIGNTIATSANGKCDCSDVAGMCHCLQDHGDCICGNSDVCNCFMKGGGDCVCDDARQVVYKHRISTLRGRPQVKERFQGCRFSSKYNERAPAALGVVELTLNAAAGPFSAGQVVVMFNAAAKEVARGIIHFSVVGAKEGQLASADQIPVIVVSGTFATIEDGESVVNPTRAVRTGYSIQIGSATVVNCQSNLECQSTRRLPVRSTAGFFKGESIIIRPAGSDAAQQIVTITAVISSTTLEIWPAISTTATTGYNTDLVGTYRIASTPSRDLAPSISSIDWVALGDETTGVRNQLHLDPNSGHVWSEDSYTARSRYDYQQPVTGDGMVVDVGPMQRYQGFHTHQKYDDGSNAPRIVAAPEVQFYEDDFTYKQAVLFGDNSATNGDASQSAVKTTLTLSTSTTVLAHAIVLQTGPATSTLCTAAATFSSQTDRQLTCHAGAVTTGVVMADSTGTTVNVIVTRGAFDGRDVKIGSVSTSTSRWDTAKAASAQPLSAWPGSWQQHLTTWSEDSTTFQKDDSRAAVAHVNEKPDGEVEWQAAPATDIYHGDIMTDCPVNYFTESWGANGQDAEQASLPGDIELNHVLGSSLAIRCHRCPENAVSPRGSISVTQCKCNKGYYGVITELFNANDDIVDSSSVWSDGTTGHSRHSIEVDADQRQSAINPNSDVADLGENTIGGKCVICEADHYSGATGLELCAICPAHSSTHGKRGSTAASECKCDPGYFGTISGEASASGTCTLHPGYVQV